MPILLALDGWNEVVDKLDPRDSGTSGVVTNPLELEFEAGLSNDCNRGNAV